MGFEFGSRCRQRSCVSAPLTSPFEAFEPFESERGLSCGLEIDHKPNLTESMTGRSLSFSSLRIHPTPARKFVAAKLDRSPSAAVLR